jgi:RHS repeat-associated protein
MKWNALSVLCLLTLPAHAAIEVSAKVYYDYDELGRVIAERGNYSAGSPNESRLVTYEYDANGNVTSTTDGSVGQERTMVFNYDALDRIASSVDPSQKATRFEYDGGSHLIKVTDPRSNVTSYSYDGFGQLWVQTSPDTGQTAFNYDPVGQRVSTTRASGQLIAYGYDGMGRTTTATAGAAVQTYTYDSCANGKGRLCGLTDPTGSVSYSYTAEGLIASQSSQMPASGSASLAYAYDAIGRLSSITYPGGVSANYGYAAGRLDSLEVNVGGVPATIVSSAKYQPFGPLSGWGYGNGLSRGFNYDLDGRMTGLSVGTGSAVLQSLTYAYNANNQIKAITNGINASLSQNYGYDELTRLTSATGTSDNQAFAYDANSNRTSHTRNGITDAYTTSALSNRLQGINGGRSVTYTYDLDGNIVGDGSAVYTYDVFNRMDKAVEGGTTANYSVNGFGQRVYKQIGATNQWFVYGPSNSLLAEYKSAQGWTQYLYFEGEPVAMVRSNTISYIHSDHLGRPEAVTNSAQTVTWRASNYAFNRVVTLDQIGGLNIGFPGQYYDSETGNWNNGVRDYDDDGGRYLQSDPLGLAAGLNTYTYAHGNSIALVDPYGLDTYYMNRDLSAFGDSARSLFNPVTHTFTFTTNPDGSIKATYSWGNDANIRGWNLNQPIDIKTAKEALEKGLAMRVGGANMDPFVAKAFDMLNKPENEHPNLILGSNCKAETDNLLNLARDLQIQAGAYP